MIRNCIIRCGSLAISQLFGHIVEQIFVHVFDQGNWEGTKTINTVYGSTRPWEAQETKSKKHTKMRVAICYRKFLVVRLHSPLHFFRFIFRGWNQWMLVLDVRRIGPGKKGGKFSINVWPDFWSGFWPGFDQDFWIRRDSVQHYRDDSKQKQTRNNTKAENNLKHISATYRGALG